MSRTTWVKTWNGNEHLREEIRALAHKIVATDLAVRNIYASSVATGLICGAIDSSGGACQEVVLAASAHQKLQELHTRLVWECGIEFDFVRREWATILNPSQEEKDLCDRLCA